MERVTPSSLPVGTYDLAVARVEYDEFGLFHENLHEWGLDVAVPKVRREFYEVAPGRRVSALVWGDDAPEVVLVHGGGQNAHTYDTVALAMQRPLISVDLPGHGHSDAAPFGNGSAITHANDLAVALSQVLTRATPLVGMSLGGMTSLILAGTHGELISKLALIDVTPGITPDKAQHITAFLNGPTSFDDFDALLARTIEHNPTRSVSSLRRGILHNALQREDGTWVWRHQRHPRLDVDVPPNGDMWQRISDLAMPLTLVRGMAKGSVVDDADETEFQRRRPDATVIHVEGAGHSVQGDQPLELAKILSEFITH